MSWFATRLSSVEIGEIGNDLLDMVIRAHPAPGRQIAGSHICVRAFHDVFIPLRERSPHVVRGADDCLAEVPKLFIAVVTYIRPLHDEPGIVDCVSNVGGWPYEPHINIDNEIAIVGFGSQASEELRYRFVMQRPRQFFNTQSQTETVAGILWHS